MKQEKKKKKKEKEKTKKNKYGKKIKKKKNKKHKISFSGFISQNDCDFNQLITTINIESYKQYNAKMSYNINGKIEKERLYCTSKSCFII